MLALRSLEGSTAETKMKGSLQEPKVNSKEVKGALYDIALLCDLYAIE